MAAQLRIASPSFLDDPRLRRLLTVLNGGGEEARVVGGAVRNHLMHVPVHEVDIATTATPEVVIARAKASELKCVPTGIDHGTVTIVVDHVPYEVTTLREDVETDGRRAKVAFGRDFDADAMRRDFTINALSTRADGEIFDPAGGFADIERRHVRFIGDADVRIREDYLRILRFFRFHAAYGVGEPDAGALQAIGANRDGLDSLSRERVRAELLKLLEARAASDVVELMSGLGLLVRILGGVAMPMRLAQLMAIEHAREEKPDAVLRLAALAVLTREDAERLRPRLRLSNDGYTRLVQAADARAKLHARAVPPPFGELRTFLFLQGRRAACDATALAHAESGMAPDHAGWRSAARFLADTPEPRMPFGGADIVRRGVAPGKAVGEVLKILQAAWIRAGFPDAPHELARLIGEALATYDERRNA
ncbi:MAG: tRNA nucleotidyltransferase [Hyphomicrobiales bacterium]|nr:tRNA nucleotidyltransferase [Hyphomicrobiales bacterium]